MTKERLLRYVVRIAVLYGVSILINYVIRKTL